MYSLFLSRINRSKALTNLAWCRATSSLLNTSLEELNRQLKLVALLAFRFQLPFRTLLNVEAISSRLPSSMSTSLNAPSAVETEYNASNMSLAFRIELIGVDRVIVTLCYDDAASDFNCGSFAVPCQTVKMEKNCSSILNTVSDNWGHSGQLKQILGGISKNIDLYF